MTAIDRAQAAIRDAEAALSASKRYRAIQELKASADRLDLRLTYLRAGQLLRAADATSARRQS